MLPWFAALMFLNVAAAPAPSQDLAANTENVPPLLFDALGKVARSFDRWAYTETRVTTTDKGVVKGETVIRFDPSLPYAEQFRPLKIEGKEPTSRQLKEYRTRGEKRGERLAKEEEEGKAPGSTIPRFGINGGTASIDLAHAVVVAESAESVTFEVPLRNDSRATIPVEKFQLLARVGRQQRAFENVALKVRSPFRLKLVIKVKTGEASLDFAEVDPRFPPALTKVTGDGTASLMFVRLGASFDLVRTDFKRVKPYSERFGVKIGPLKALNF
ncbi:MAG: hypothetical protein JWM88_90 [Verrucomicrobia bacterium]|nr:hypothetical protein [Verrucomicrobiota bacterium]